MMLTTTNKLTRIAFALNGSLFLLGGILLLGDSKYAFAIIQLLAAVLNIAMLLKIRSTKTVNKLNYAILIMNVIVCLSIATDSFMSGKSYIQYAWILAAIVSFVALLIQRKKIRVSTDKG